MARPEIQILSIGGTPYITAADAARTSGLSSAHITRLARAGKFPAQRLGRNWFIALSALRTLT